MFLGTRLKFCIFLLLLTSCSDDKKPDRNLEQAPMATGQTSDQTSPEKSESSDSKIPIATSEIKTKQEEAGKKQAETPNNETEVLPSTETVVKPTDTKNETQSSLGEGQAAAVSTVTQPTGSESLPSVITSPKNPSDVGNQPENEEKPKDPKDSPESVLVDSKPSDCKPHSLDGMESSTQNPPAWVRGPSTLGVLFSGDVSKQVKILFDAPDVARGFHLVKDCQEGQIALDLPKEIKFYSYPKVKKVWVAADHLDFELNAQKQVAADISPYLGDGVVGMLLNAKIKANISPKNYSFLRRMFPAAALVRLRQEPEAFRQNSSVFPPKVEMRELNENSLLAEGDVSTLQVIIPEPHYNDVRCTLRIHDALVSSGLSVHDDEGKTFSTGHLIHFLIGERIHRFTGLPPEALSAKDQVSVSFSSLDPIVLQSVESKNAMVDVFLVPTVDSPENLSPMNQVAWLIERNLAAAMSLNKQSLNCPVEVSQNQTEFVQKALEVLSKDEAAFKQYKSSFQ